MLADMANKVNTLLSAANPKLGSDQGALLLADIAAAQTCVTQLMSQ